MAEAIDRAELIEDDADDDREFVRIRPATDPSQVYSVRIPVPMLEQLRTAAARRGVAPSALMRQWVVEKLADEARPKELQVIMVHLATEPAPTLLDTERALGDRMEALLSSVGNERLALQ